MTKQILLNDRQLELMKLARQLGCEIYHDAPRDGKYKSRRTTRVKGEYVPALRKYFIAEFGAENVRMYETKNAMGSRRGVWGLSVKRS